MLRLTLPRSLPQPRVLSLGVIIAGATLGLPVAAQVQFAQLLSRGLPHDADQTDGVALGDVDGDGDLDVVFASRGAQNRLYLNDDAGLFVDATAARLPVDADPTTCVTALDVDGDGDLDLLFGNRGRQNRLYLNDGSGVFVDRTAVRLPPDLDRTTSLATGDVDGDGDPDLVVGNGVDETYAAGTLNRLYLNDGRGAFADASERLPADADPTEAPVLADFDGDGDLDLFVGNAWLSRYSSYGWSSIAVPNRLYRNNGRGEFAASSTSFPAFPLMAHDAAAGDVDSDGDVDLVVTNGRDIIGYGSSRDQLLLNDGQGGFVDATPQSFWTVDSGRALALSDFDGDGDLDVVFVNGTANPFYPYPYGAGTSQNRLLLNDGSGTFADATMTHLPVDDTPSHGVAAGDLDGDGDLDLVVGEFGDELRVPGQPNRALYNDGTARMTESVSAPRLPGSFDPTADLALGDVDGDGHADLFAANLAEQDRLYLGDGRGRFFDVTRTSVPMDSATSTAVVAADFDRDGDLDFAIARQAAPNRLYLNQGGVFAAAGGRLPTSAEETFAVAAGDVDGDGDIDLVWGNRGTQNELDLNDGSGFFTRGSLPPDADPTTDLALCDVDLDGDLDVLVANEGTQNRLYRNDPGGWLDVTAQQLPPDQWPTVAVVYGDVDGDGAVDVVFGNDRQSDRLLLNQGDGSFRLAPPSTLPSQSYRTTALVLGDVDADGDVDVLTGKLDGATELSLNDGAGGFVAAPGRLAGFEHPTTALALQDLDGDGDLEMLEGVRGPNRLSLNLLRQLDSALPVRAPGALRLDVYARYTQPRPTMAVPLLASAPAQIPVSPFGTLGLEPSLTVALPPLALTAAGDGSLGLSVPAQPTLVGRSVFAQALLLPPAGTSALTNATADVILP
ncbi:MAG: VCBS repeat-containing protein [Planctomycetota bacterium]